MQNGLSPNTFGTSRKANRVMRALNRLMSNLRDPNEKRRRLYANVLLSVIMYDAPVWGKALRSSKLLGGLLDLERTIAQGVISAYRTVSGNVALLLARLPPLHLLASMCKRVYERIRAHREDGDYSRKVRNAIKEDEQARLYDEWRVHLERPNTPGEFIKLSIMLRFEAWLDRGFGGMSFHITQMLTGHDCFAKFLYRIGRRNDSCDFCGDPDVNPDVNHTLRECPVWNPDRIDLWSNLNLNRDLGDVVESILESEDYWYFFSAFVEKVMREKENEEKRLERIRLFPLFIIGDGEDSG